MRVRGTLVRNEIQRRGSDEAARIKDLLALGKRLSAVSPSGFDPDRPIFTDWQRLLELVARDYSKELAATQAETRPVGSVPSRSKEVPATAL